jgi:hypothetical protein
MQLASWVPVRHLLLRDKSRHTFAYIPACRVRAADRFGQARPRWILHHDRSREFPYHRCPLLAVVRGIS